MPALAGCRAPSGSRPPLEVADILRAHAEAYSQRHPLTGGQAAAISAITNCRTSTLGGHIHSCGPCGFSHIAYNSCRNRHCPKCQALAQHRWVEQRTERTLPTRHFHVVFTLPHDLNALVMGNRAEILAILFRTAAATLLAFGRDPKWVGGQLGVTCVLHTWSRDLQFHPHLHCIVTDGGLMTDPDSGSAWVRGRFKAKFLFPVKALAKVFRARFLEGLADARDAGRLRFGASCAALSEKAAFKAFEKRLYKKCWVVYAQAPLRGVEHVIRYLGRYTHRVALSNQRLVSMDDAGIRFRTKDGRTCTVSPNEFIRRFLLHILPRGFVKIRHYGLYASVNVNTKLQIARNLLGEPDSTSPADEPHLTEDEDEPDWLDHLLALTGINLKRCPQCGARLRTRKLKAPPGRVGIVLTRRCMDPAPPPG